MEEPAVGDGDEGGVKAEEAPAAEKPPEEGEAPAVVLETVPEETAEEAAKEDSAVPAEVPEVESQKSLPKDIGGETDVQTIEQELTPPTTEKTAIDEAPADSTIPGSKKASLDEDKKLVRQGSKFSAKRSDSTAKTKRDSSKKSLEIVSEKKDSTSKDLLLKRQSDRTSKAKIVLGSVISLKRGSTTGELLDKSKVARFMNSYKLDSDKPFEVGNVEKILKNVMLEVMDGMVYDPNKCPKQAKYATSAIRARVKEQEYDRYKIVIIVTFGEKSTCDMFSTCRFLWDCDRDKFAMFVHENMHVYGIALCFGLYYE